MAHSGLDFIKSISTIHTVHDLDKIRTKLNIDSWSMLGYSYGTKTSPSTPNITRRT
ncbi:alpha/beta hydrolase [Moraxella ovis]|uniref:alpha/beta hydrolase n=1 Tax=Moraxella ovis TaxID=29433 RepID=UPI000AA9A5F6|nr:alpha/beta hydrolase [Moraxella ovis]